MSELYLIIKHIRSGGLPIDDQEYQLILAKLRQIESALIAIDSQQPTVTESQQQQQSTTETD